MVEQPSSNPENELPSQQPMDPQALIAQAMEEKQVVAEVRDDYLRWKEQRRQFEGTWFTNGAMLRGQQRLRYDDTLAKLTSPVVPSHRIQLTINRIRPKVLSRLAKFFKNRPKPEVSPASTERKDILNARATQKILNYIWSKNQLEQKHKDARLWASICGKSFWWFSWNDQAAARIQVEDPMTGMKSEAMVKAGDVDVEVGSAFEVLVADPTISRIGSQPAIIRARLQDIEDVRQRYPEIAQEIEAEMKGGEDETRYPERLAQLNVKDNLFAGAGAPRQDHRKQLLVIEHFKAPCGAYPNGRYVVLVGEKLAKYEQELPYGMADHLDNPYPVVEFSDQPTPGQFWTTTLVEQLIDIQREYNFVRSLIAENIRMMARPKIILYAQHNLPDGAWTTAAGEIVTLSWIPGLPAPIILQPSNIVGDCWNLLALIQKEFDDVTQIFPASEGKTAGGTSGFQTNLLQEASNSVHQPDIREDEITIQDACWKIRRLCKLGFDIPRLYAIAGDRSSPEVMEFSKDQIDENAEVRIRIGSMLPDLKASRAQVVKEMWKEGMLGDPNNPLTRRAALRTMDMEGMDQMYENERIDEDDANHTLQMINEGQAVGVAQFFHDHVTYITIFQNDLKSPETQAQDEGLRQAKIARLITHYDWVNPLLAQGLRLQYGLELLPVATPPPPQLGPGMGPQGPGMNPQPNAPTGGPPAGGMSPPPSGPPGV